jgi:hypothetical protein
MTRFPGFFNLPGRDRFGRSDRASTPFELISVDVGDRVLVRWTFRPLRFVVVMAGRRRYERIGVGVARGIGKRIGNRVGVHAVRHDVTSRVSECPLIAVAGSAAFFWADVFSVGETPHACRRFVSVALIFLYAGPAGASR